MKEPVDTHVIQYLAPRTSKSQPYLSISTLMMNATQNQGKQIFTYLAYIFERKVTVSKYHKSSWAKNQHCFSGQKAQRGGIT